MRSSLVKGAVPSRALKTKLQAILCHVALAFSGKGYEGASIRGISRSSGVSLAGMYYDVESKQKLLYLIQLKRIRRS